MFLKSLSASVLSVMTTVAMAWQPAQTVDAVIGFSPGSGNEIIFRAVATEVEKNTGVRFNVVHKPGAGGVIGTEYFYKKPADGHTVLVGSMLGIYAMDPVAVPDTKNRTFTVDSFSYVLELANSSFAIIANANDPVKNARDFVDLLRSGQKVTLGSLGGSRLVQESLRDRLKYGDNVIWVQHKGPADQIADVASGNLRFSIAPSSVAVPFLEGANPRVKIVAVSTKQAESVWPTVQTLDSVLPGMVIPAEWGLLLPKGADPKVVEWYRREFTKAIKSKEVQAIYRQNFFRHSETQLDPKTWETYVKNQQIKYRPLIDRLVSEAQKQKP